MKTKVAVIGSGISGLSSALFLSKKCDVYLFEKNSILGGHTRTVNFIENKRNLSIDTGFIVFNDKNYPDLISFFKYLKVPTNHSNMSFSVSSAESNFEYGGANLNALFAQRKNIFSLKFLYLIIEILSLYKKANKIYLNQINNKNITIENFLNTNGFSEKLKELHLYPIISSIWSVNNNDVKNFPFLSFVEFFSNHGLFSIYKRPQWKFVEGGSYSYVKKIIDKNLFNFQLNSKISKISRKNNQIQIFTEKEKFIFDKLIFANHADQALELLDTPSDNENNILSLFTYSKNKAYLHTDNSFMPKSNNAWSSWNFLKKKNTEKFSLTYWMNQLQKIDSNINYFVTINPSNIPNNIIDSTMFEHPIFTTKTHTAQKKLNTIQGFNNTFYCGSYCGYGFHEDGIQSAAYISNLFQVKLPWERNSNFVSRLNYS